MALHANRIWNMVYQGLADRNQKYNLGRRIAHCIFPEEFRLLMREDDRHRDRFDELVFLTLLFMMSHYAFRSTGCTFTDVAAFIRSTGLIDEDPTNPPDYQLLAHKLVLSSLMNDGQPFSLTNYNANTPGGAFEHAQVTLIEDHGDSFTLSTDAYDYLYRLYEINDYAKNYSALALRMQQCFRRGNYAEAKASAGDILQTIQGVVALMGGLLTEAASVSARDASARLALVDQQVNEIYRSGQLGELQAEIELRLKQLHASGAEQEVNDLELVKKRRDLDELDELVRLVIVRRNELFETMRELKEGYERQVSSLLMGPINPDQFDVAKLLERSRREDVRLDGLARTVCLPELAIVSPRWLSPIRFLADFCAPVRDQNVKPSGVDLDAVFEETEDLRAAELARRTRKMYESFSEFANEHPTFTASEWLGCLTVREVVEFAGSHLLFSMLSQLWLDSPVELASLRDKAKDEDPEGTDAHLWLAQVAARMEGVRRLNVRVADEGKVSHKGELDVELFSMDDFVIEVE